MCNLSNTFTIIGFMHYVACLLGSHLIFSALTTKFNYEIPKMTYLSLFDSKLKYTNLSDVLNTVLKCCSGKAV